MAYSVDQIVEILVEYCDTKLSLRKFCKEKGISTRTLKNWLDGDLPKRRRPNGFRHPPMYPEIEAELVRWVNERRSNATAVLRKDITAYAIKLAAASGHENFAVSAGWVTKFMKKHEPVYRARTKTSRRLELTEADMVSDKQWQLYEPGC